MTLPVSISHTSTADEARSFLALGYCPVECSFGVESVVDDLRLDHHGTLSELEPVSLRASRDFAGFRRTDPRFVVTGAADADATFAIAALAGLLPTSDPEREAGPILDLARTIAQADLDPFAQRWKESGAGMLLLSYKQRMKHGRHETAAFYAGVECWRELVANPPRDLLATVRAEETARVAQAKKAAVSRLGPDTAFVECPAWGWDVWYTEIAPVIVTYVRASGRCSIGCRNRQTAIRLFGSDGLLGIARVLAPDGWGGRETIIGSPRGTLLSRDSALNATRQVATLLASSSAQVPSLALAGAGAR